MEDMIIIYSILFTVIIVTALIIYLKSPFDYPYFVYNFDVSGKRSPNIEDLIDSYLICGGFTGIQNHNIQIQKWKSECEIQIEQCLLKYHRRQQYLACLDDAHAYRFTMTRYQTRYRQVNYVKTPYKVEQIEKECSFDYDYFVKRDAALQAINYECTLSEYHNKNQRRLLTKELRREISLRDNHTCQICGKYMPDGVGLQIDHIVPVSKGGKTVRSNLQVTCSKCNGRKSNKTSSV